MKTLWLIRHAEAGWGDFGQADVERSLTERGMQQAHDIASKICDANLVPDMIFSSTAKRTEMTTQILAAEMGFPIEKVAWHHHLYLAEADILFAMAKQTTDDIKSLAIIAHNPGLSELASHLLPDDSMHGMSPATAVLITWHVEHWQDIAAGTGVLSAYLCSALP